MKIFSELLDNVKARLTLEKQAEILEKIKKPFYDVANGANKLSPTTHLNRDDCKIIVDLKLAEDGTLRTYLKGEPEPVRFYSQHSTVWLVAMYKRLIPLLIKRFITSGWINKIATILFLKYNIKLFSDWFHYIFYINPILFKEEHYSQPVKEIRRVLKGKIDENFIDAISLVLEHDSAYRYRFQDIIVCLNKVLLKQNPAREICRLMDIIIEREEARMNHKWKSVKKFIKLALFFPTKYRKLLVEIMGEINLEELKFSKEDTYWAGEYQSYNFGGKTLEKRKLENKLKYNKL